MFHSIKLRKKKIELYINKSAIAYLELNEKPKKIKDFIGENSRDLKIRKNFVIINDLSIFRMYTVYVLKFLIIFFQKNHFSIHHLYTLIRGKALLEKLID